LSDIASAAPNAWKSPNRNLLLFDAGV